MRERERKNKFDWRVREIMREFAWRREWACAYEKKNSAVYYKIKKERGGWQISTSKIN